MQYIKGLDAFDGRNQTAVTLGKFDGLHRGHQKLLNRIIKYAQKEDCDSVVCASFFMTKIKIRSYNNV